MTVSAAHLHAKPPAVFSTYPQGVKSAPVIEPHRHAQRPRSGFFICGRGPEDADRAYREFEQFFNGKMITQQQFPAIEAQALANLQRTPGVLFVSRVSNIYGEPGSDPDVTAQYKKCGRQGGKSWTTFSTAGFRKLNPDEGRFPFDHRNVHGVNLKGLTGS